MSEKEKQEILSRQRYKTYAEAYKNDMNAVWEEFICDVMSGMIDYANNFTDVVNEYWNSNETAEGYNPADYASSKDAGGETRYSLFPGGVFPSYNKSHSDANEQASRWAHNDDIETGAQRIFFYKDTAYLVEKFDSMDLGYLVVKKLSKKSLSRYERNMIEYKERDNDGRNSRLQSGRKDSVSDNERYQGFRESRRGSSNDSNSSDRYNGEIAEVQGMDREQDEERDSRNNRSGDNKHSVKDREKVSRSLKDSAGNNLTETQQEYFKDSKVRDENGNLRVMYQGSAEDFTVFDRKKSSYANLYGRGFYFTDSEAHAKQYGNSKAYYLNIKNPVSTKETTITKQQLHKFLEAVSENEDYSFENYGYGATIDGVVEDVYGKSDFLMLYDINQTAIGDLVEAVELFNEVNGTSFDGLILDTETVTFNSEQAKLTSNEVPTSNPDTRYSLTGDYNKSSSNSKRMSADDTENKINELKTEIANIEEELEFTFDDTDERKLQNKLFKLRHDLDELVAAERRATVKTSIPEIIENLGKYRLSDLHSLAEQVSDNNWDDYEDLSREELESALEEQLTTILDDLDPDDANNKKYGFFVRPVQEKGKVVEFRPKAKGDNDGVRYSLADDSNGDDLTEVEKEDINYGVGKTDDKVKSIKGQIQEHLSDLSKMKPVFDDNVYVTNKGKTLNKQWILPMFEKFGYKVKRDDIGKIVLDKKRISKSLSYLKTDEELAAYSALPYVLRQGKLYPGHKNHKSRGYDTVTIMAPVVINEVRGNMAVVVRMSDDGTFYKVHRILMPDGSSFVYETKKALLKRRRLKQKM